MKKILFLAAALFAFAGCNDEKPLDENKPGEGVKDEISVNPSSKSFGKDGGDVDVTVTSSGTWALSSDKEYTWITPSAKSGKDGAVVKFIVAANETAEEQSAVFTFKTGEATANFTVTLAAGDAPAPSVQFELKNPSQKEISFEANGGSAMVEFNTSLSTSDITLTKSADWVTAQLAQVSSPVLGIIISANTAAERTATVTLSAEGANDIVISITQAAGSEPEPSDKLNVVNFDGACLYSNWPAPAPFTDMTAFTAEMLVNAEEFYKGSNSDQEINTLIGIEGRFLIRIIGSSGSDQGDVEVVHNNSNGENKLNGVASISTNKWYHIATTFDNGKVALYVNGEKKGEKTLENGITSVTLQTGEWTSESNWSSKRNFYLGFSCDNRRCLKGNMSEVRIWNKALTESDLKAAGHFYSVDAASSGLVAYWKLNEGSGNVAKDATSNGNDLYGHTGIGNNGNGGSTQNTEGIQWKEVTDTTVQ